jgi:hypothetical protein
VRDQIIKQTPQIIRASSPVDADKIEGGRGLRGALALVKIFLQTPLVAPIPLPL